MSASQESSTYDLSLLEASFEKWETSSSLRAYYRNLYANLLSHRTAGVTLEIGSGCGFVKNIDSSVITTDLVKTQFVEEQASAYSIEALPLSFQNIIAVDVLHHLAEPTKFFESASKSLEKGSRILLSEPAATPFGKFFYNQFHHEPCAPELIIEPFHFKADESGLFANMGMGIALFHERTGLLKKKLTTLGLKIRKIAYRDFMAYPLTGGFSKPALLPSKAIAALLIIESKLPQFLLRNLGLRMTIILEKT